MTKKVGFVGLLAILFVLSMAIGISAMAAGSAEWENQSGQGSVAESDGAYEITYGAVAKFNEKIDLNQGLRFRFRLDMTVPEDGLSVAKDYFSVYLIDGSVENPKAELSAANRGIELRMGVVSAEAYAAGDVKMSVYTFDQKEGSFYTGEDIKSFGGGMKDNLPVLEMSVLKRDNFYTFVTGSHNTSETINFSSGLFDQPCHVLVGFADSQYLQESGIKLTVETCEESVAANYLGHASKLTEHEDGSFSFEDQSKGYGLAQMVNPLEINQDKTNNIYVQFRYETTPGFRMLDNEPDKSVYPQVDWYFGLSVSKNPYYAGDNFGAPVAIRWSPYFDPTRATANPNADIFKTTGKYEGSNAGIWSNGKQMGSADNIVAHNGNGGHIAPLSETLYGYFRFEIKETETNFYVYGGTTENLVATFTEINNKTFPDGFYLNFNYNYLSGFENCLYAKMRFKVNSEPNVVKENSFVDLAKGDYCVADLNDNNFSGEDAGLFIKQSENYVAVDEKYYYVQDNKVYLKQDYLMQFDNDITMEEANDPEIPIVKPVFKIVSKIDLLPNYTFSGTFSLICDDFTPAELVEKPLNYDRNARGDFAIKLDVNSTEFAGIWLGSKKFETEGWYETSGESVFTAYEEGKEYIVYSADTQTLTLKQVFFDEAYEGYSDSKFIIECVYPTKLKMEPDQASSFSRIEININVTNLAEPTIDGEKTVNSKDVQDLVYNYNFGSYKQKSFVDNAGEAMDPNNYVQTENIITIKKEYLQTLTPGKYVLTMQLENSVNTEDGMTHPQYTVKILFEIPGETTYIKAENAEIDVKKGETSAIEFILETTPSTIEIKMNGTVVDSKNYSAANNKLVFERSYIETLENGKIKFDAVCDNGSFSVTINLSDGNEETDGGNTGCGGSVQGIGLATAACALCAGVLLMIKRKQAVNKKR